MFSNQTVEFTQNIWISIIILTLVTSCNIPNFAPRQGSGEGWSEHQTGDGRKFFHNEVWIRGSNHVARSRGSRGLLTGDWRFTMGETRYFDVWEWEDCELWRALDIATETNGWHHFGVKKPMDVHITLQRIPGMEAIQVGLAAWNFQAPCFFFTAYRQYREQNHINLDSRIYSSFQTEKGKEWESTIIMLSSIWILPMRHLGS